MLSENKMNGICLTGFFLKKKKKILFNLQNSSKNPYIPFPQASHTTLPNAPDMLFVTKGPHLGS